MNRRPHAPLHLVIADGLDEADGDAGTDSVRMDPVDALTIDDATTPDAIAQSESLGRHVRAIVATMPPRVQQTLMRHVVHDLTYKQICARTGLSIKQVNTDICHAYERLRKVLP